MATNRIGIITAIPLEFDAVSEQLGLSDEVCLRDAPTYRRGLVCGYEVIATVALDKGSVFSTIATMALLRDWDPQICVLLGMAGGHGSEVELGTVVFGKIIIAYEYFKVEDKRIRVAPRQYPVEAGLLQVVNELGSEIHSGPIGSGSKVVASEEFKAWLEETNHKDLCCLEMEAEGVAASCYAARPRRHFIVLKAISDLANEATKGKKTRQEELDEKKQQTEATKKSAIALQKILSSRRMRQMYPPETITPKSKEVASPSQLQPNEAEFLMRTKSSSLRCGNVNLQAQVFPESLWLADPSECAFVDDLEHEAQLQIEFIDDPLPENMLSQLMMELEEKIKVTHGRDTQAVEVHERLMKSGSNSYPRLLGTPSIEKTLDKKVMRIMLGPSRYGIALIQERGIDLPTAEKLSTRT